MKNEFEDLQRKWQDDKKEIENKPTSMDGMLSSVTAKKNSTVRFHYGNIIVLFITMLGLSAFFYYVAPVQELLSRIGVTLMIGGLLSRIIIEFVSVSKSKKIDLVDDVLTTTKGSISFYTFRKRIHGPVTIIIITLYSIGFYMITPEFSLYFTTRQMILMDISYVIGAIISIGFVRRGITKEMKNLVDIIELKEKMVEENLQQ